MCYPSMQVTVAVVRIQVGVDPWHRYVQSTMRGVIRSVRMLYTYLSRRADICSGSAHVTLVRPGLGLSLLEPRVL